MIAIRLQIYMDAARDKQAVAFFFTGDDTEYKNKDHGREYQRVGKSIWKDVTMRMMLSDV